MPALGMQQDTGTLIAWLKTDGESVAKGEPVMEIETDKVTVEIEAPASGILGGMCANEGDVIPVGQTVAWILSPGEPVPPEGREGRLDRTSVSPITRRPAEEQGVGLAQVQAERGQVWKDDARKPTEAEPASEGARLVPASPKARRLSRERGLDLESLVGTGPDGAVLAADVLATQASAIETRYQSIEPSTVWRVMAERVTQCWTSTPHFYLLREVNASRLLAWRERMQNLIEPRPTYTDLLIKLVAAALSRHGQINASWESGKIVLHREINIGLAVAVKDGLVVPVIHRANELSLSLIVERRQNMVSRAQAGRLSVEDLANGTFTLSNLGMYGVDIFNAIVNPPQAAILAVGRIAERVVPIDGQPAVQPMMILSLSCDHRVVDGARGAQFLATLAGFIEEPFLLLE
jgi:pyruvate dehydrogenase E2 component (dihydrolipoamide acetyltransferase)